MHIHALLNDRADSNLDTFILQIGAMDGKTGDPVHPFLMENDWPALLVEPINDYFHLLKETYRNRSLVELANLCVSDHSGTVPFYRVDPDAIDKGIVPKWGHGASSLYMDRTAIGWDHVKPYVQKETVPCLTLPDLLSRYGVKKIDVLQIDAEGHDYAILKQLDFKRYRPDIINLEIVNLPQVQQDACKTLLNDNGYVCEKTGYDLVAVIDPLARQR